MKIIQIFAASIGLFALKIVPGAVLEDTTDKGIDEYDTKLSNFLIEILENFRDQMPVGIPDIGVPAVDPLVIPNVDEKINDKAAQLDLRMRELNITGISKFRLQSLKADLVKGFVNISLSLPEMEADGHCYMNGKVLNIFPITSDGPFFIRVTGVQIMGYGDLNVTTGEHTRIRMNDLNLHLTFESLKIEFQSLLGGGRWTKMLLKLVTGLGPKLFLHFHEEAMSELNETLLKLINKELDKGTLSELLDLIPLATQRTYV